MRRIIAIFLLSLCLCSAASAQKRDRPAFRAGASWGYGINFLRYWNYNYVDPDFGRIWDEGTDFQPDLNAYLRLDLGIDAAPFCTLNLQSGITGITERRQVFSLGLGADFYPEGHDEDGPLILAGGGVGFREHIYNIPVWYASAGGGWHLALSRLWDLNFTLQLRVSGDKPPIYDADRGYYVNESDIRGNRSVVCALEFGVSVGF